MYFVPRANLVSLRSMIYNKIFLFVDIHSSTRINISVYQYIYIISTSLFILQNIALARCEYFILTLSYISE